VRPCARSRRDTARRRLGAQGGRASAQAATPSSDARHRSGRDFMRAAPVRWTVRPQPRERASRRSRLRSGGRAAR
jgi:hypothetical protein